MNQAIVRFAALAPATSNCLVQVDAPTAPWTAAYKPDQQLFVGSVVKTFILAQFLRDAEAGREGLSESQLCEVSDALLAGQQAFFSQKSTTGKINESIIDHGLLKSPNRAGPAPPAPARFSATGARPRLKTLSLYSV